MSHQLTIRQVCERALRKIGAFAIHEDAADPRQLQEAQFWFDMIVAHLAGGQRLFWLVPATIPITLQAGVQAFDLLDAMGPAVPPDGVMFPIAATVGEAGRSVGDLDIIRRGDWDDIPDKSLVGPPRVIHIDRLDRPTASIFPIPPATPTYVANLTVQTYPRDLSPSGLPPERQPGFRASWNLWAVMALAAEIGSGPVARLDDGEYREVKSRADELLNNLLAYQAQEQADEPRQIRFNDPGL